MAKKPQSPKAREREPEKPRPVWLCVFELTGSTVERRFPDKPHVCVEQKVIEPGEALDAWLKRARANKRPRLKRVLYEKMPAQHEPGGLHNPFQAPRDRSAIKNALKKLRGDLRCAGYTIGDSPTVWSVYAIELDDRDLAKKPAGYKGYVYVGQTSLPVEERVKQHDLGKNYPWKNRPKFSAECHRRFRRYAPELIPEKWKAPIPCRKKALQAERDLRKHLERQDYRVLGGTELLPKKPRKRPEEPPPSP
jgi:hypothetical protein